MSLLTLKDLLSESIEKRYAVGAFDSFDFASTEGIIAAAEDLNAPLILMATDQLFTSAWAERFFRHMLQRARSSSAPITVLLDHGSSLDAVRQAIDFGFSSVMIDGSSLPIEENIALTQQVCKLAREAGISVEAEIGHVSGHEGNMLEGNEPDKSAYTKLDEALQFYEATGVDALAVAIGTVHGVFKGKPELDFERLAALRAALPIPLVMHGGSGLSDAQFREAIQKGINKINVFTTMTTGASKASLQAAEERGGKLYFHDLVNPGVEQTYQIVKEHILLFGTQPLATG